MKMFFDTESGSVISEKDLQAEFLTLAAAGGTDCETFTEYLRACTGKNGCLIPVMDIEYKRGDIMNDRKIWYAVMRDRDDNDWGYGSYDFSEAKKMCVNLGENAYIAVIDNYSDPVCIDEIMQSDF